MLGGLPERDCITKHLPIHGFSINVDPHTDPLAVYGREKDEVISIGKEKKKYAGFLSEKLQIYKSQVIWAVRNEMARTVEDFLARRTRALFLDARESISIAPVVADLMASELGMKRKWKKAQIEEFEAVAKNYFLEK